MGKKSRNPKKAGVNKADKPYLSALAAVDGTLANTACRAAAAARLPSPTCHHMPERSNVDREQQWLGPGGLKEYLGHKQLNRDQMELAAMTIVWAKVPQFEGMSELLLAKATEYLLHYDYHDIRNVLLDIIFAYGGLQEVLLCGESAEPDFFTVTRGGKSYLLLYCYLLALQSEIHFSSHINPFCY